MWHSHFPLHIFCVRLANAAVPVNLSCPPPPRPHFTFYVLRRCLDLLAGERIRDTCTAAGNTLVMPPPHVTSLATKWPLNINFIQLNHSCDTFFFFFSCQTNFRTISVVCRPYKVSEDLSNLSKKLVAVMGSSEGPVVQAACNDIERMRIACNSEHHSYMSTHTISYMSPHTTATCTCPHTP